MRREETSGSAVALAPSHAPSFRLIDYEAAKEAVERGAKENASFVRNDSGVIVDLNSKAKHLQLQFTVEDAGDFTTPPG